MDVKVTYILLARMEQILLRIAVPCNSIGPTVAAYQRGETFLSPWPPAGVSGHQAGLGSGEPLPLVIPVSFVLESIPLRFCCRKSVCRKVTGIKERIKGLL